jgi:uncharacterized membrane protein
VARAAQDAWGRRHDEAGKRDLLLDLLRGTAVFAMVVGHVGGASWLARATALIAEQGRWLRRPRDSEESRLNRGTIARCRTH